MSLAPQDKAKVVSLGSGSLMQYEVQMGCSSFVVNLTGFSITWLVQGGGGVGGVAAREI